MIGNAFGLRIAGTFAKPISVETLQAVLDELRKTESCPQPS
jgi:hypothetical protein